MMISEAKGKSGSLFQDHTASDRDEHLTGGGGEVVKDKALMRRLLY